MCCYIVNYLIFLVGEIELDLQENMLLEIILFPLSMGFGLICRMWAFSNTHNRPLGRADWAFILGWRQRPECFNGCASSLGLESGPASPLFKPYQLPPSPCVRCAWARAVTFLVSDAISTCLLGAGLVRAWSPSYVLR